MMLKYFQKFMLNLHIFYVKNQVILNTIIMNTRYILYYKVSDSTSFQYKKAKCKLLLSWYRVIIYRIGRHLVTLDNY